MCDEAANITDCILPNAPVRQSVMSLPFELRALAATKPDVLTAFGRIFASEVARPTQRLAGVAGTDTGSISFPQHFGGSLNLLVIDLSSCLPVFLFKSGPPGTGMGVNRRSSVQDRDREGADAR
jgi:hypothetical protein